MERREIASIIGAYSRQGLSASAVSGGFIVQSGRYTAQGYEGHIDFRSTKEARKDTGIDLARSVITTRASAAYRAELHA